MVGKAFPESGEGAPSSGRWAVQGMVLPVGGAIGPSSENRKVPDLPKYTLSAVRELSRGRLGLILGPAASTTNANFLNDLRDDLAQRFNVDACATYHEVGELAFSKGIEAKLIRGAIGDFAGRQTGAPIVTTLASLQWTAVISGCLDDQFEKRLQQVHARRPARRDVAVISDPRDTVPQNTLPVFKLLGSAQHQNAVATTAEFLRRMAALGSSVREFLDQIKASPILCAGFQGAQWLLDPLLAQLYSSPHRHPASLVFLLDDPIASSPRLAQLVPRSGTFLAEGSLVEVARALEPQIRSGQTSFDYTGRAGKQVAGDLSEFSDLVCVVNTRLIPDIDASERERLLDYLFMPDVPNWNPIAHDLDLPRTVLGSLQEEVIQFANDETGSAVFLLHGRAASGKTSVLKRLAFNLAEQGMFVCWLLDYLFSDMGRQLEAALRKIREAVSSAPIVLFIDSPALLRDLDLTTLFATAERLGISLLVVLGARSSDAPRIGKELDEGAGRVAFSKAELPDVLDDVEWIILPDYLLKLGISRTQEEATAAVTAAANSKQTRDSLALLYYLLPKTRQAIEGSIRSEYVSLGDSQGLKRIMAGAFSGSHPHLQDAYGMVAASTRYGVSVPAEVLVNALGVSYGEWAESVNKSGPAWGFLYPDDSDDIEGARYRTRNAVVTDIVLELINGSATNRSGEVEKLRRLLSACDSTNPVYEKFCERMLVKNGSLAGLDLAQGVELFEAAERALPQKNRAILHHKGIWIRRNGGDLDRALHAFDEALGAPTSPNSERDELDEFIHTSKAAAIIDKMDKGLIGWTEGQGDALKELERSRSPKFINPNAVHLYAGLVERLAFRQTETPEVDQYELINRALTDIDRTLIVVRAGGRVGLRASVDMLEDRRATLLARVGDIDSGAERVWENHQSQMGFVVAARRRLAAALVKRPNAGAEFKTAFDYWSSSRDRVLTRTSLAPELAEVGLVLYYLWQIEPRNREWRRTVHAPINWKLMKDCAEITLHGFRFQKDPFYRYLLGLSLAHCGEWASARVVFQENRKLGLPNDTLHVPRCYFLHAEGNPAHLQGRLNAGATSDYFNATDIQQDFEVARGERWPRNSGIQYAYVTFSFAGPRATRSETACR